MADASYTAEESRKLAVLIARAWADPQLAGEYRRAPEAVLSGAGINLAGRPAPDLPERPSELAAQRVVSGAAFSSASSLSTLTCPCTGCTASCAGVAAADLSKHLDSIVKLADSPEGRREARRMTAAWDIKFTTHA
jgi:hypothetical protein